MKRLIDIYSTPFISGIMYSLSKDSRFSNLFTILGINEEEAHAMDMEYIFNISGLKTASMLIDYLMNEYIIDNDKRYVVDKWGRHITYEHFLNELDQQIINTILAVRFAKKWDNLANTLLIDYDVTKPYDMEVSDKLGIDSKTDVNNSRVYSGSTSGSNTATETNKQSNNRYGFNSEDAVPADEVNENNSGTNTSTTSANDNTTDIGKTSRTTTNNRTITRKGNIGNRSITELIEERRDMLKYQIITEIFSDLDSVLTRSKYI